MNKATLIGIVGKKPEIRTFQNGGRVATFSLATTERCKNGEKKEKTAWHSIVVWSEGLIKVCESYIDKGSKLYLEGEIEYQTYEKDGIKQNATKINLKPYSSNLILLDSKQASNTKEPAKVAKPVGNQPDEADFIPF